MSIVQLLSEQIKEYKLTTDNQQSMYEISLQANSEHIVNQVYIYNQEVCCDLESGLEIDIGEHKQVFNANREYLENILSGLIVAQNYNSGLSEQIFFQKTTWEELTLDIQNYLYPE